MLLLRQARSATADVDDKLPAAVDSGLTLTPEPEPKPEIEPEPEPQPPTPPTPAAEMDLLNFDEPEAEPRVRGRSRSCANPLHVLCHNTDKGEASLSHGTLVSRSIAQKLEA